MHLQALIVAFLVLGCAGYSVWVLMPAAGRRRIARSLLQWSHLPAPIASRLDRHARAASGCGCDGCDAGANPPSRSGEAQTIRIHRRVTH